MIFYKQRQSGTVFIRNQATSLMVPISELKSNRRLLNLETTSKKQINGIILSKSLKNKIINSHTDLTEDTSILGVFSNIISCETINTNSISRTVVDNSNEDLYYEYDKIYKYLFNNEPFLNIYVKDNWIINVIINRGIKVLPNPLASEKLNSLLNWYFLHSNLNQIESVNESGDISIANFKHNTVSYSRPLAVPSGSVKLDMIKKLSISWGIPVDQDSYPINGVIIDDFSDVFTSENIKTDSSPAPSKNTINLTWKY